MYTHYIYTKNGVRYSYQTEWERVLYGNEGKALEPKSKLVHVMRINEDTPMFIPFDPYSIMSDRDFQRYVDFWVDKNVLMLTLWDEAYLMPGHISLICGIHNVK